MNLPQTIRQADINHFQTIMMLNVLRMLNIMEIFYKFYQNHPNIFQLIVIYITDKKNPVIICQKSLSILLKNQSLFVKHALNIRQNYSNYLTRT